MSAVKPVPDELMRFAAFQVDDEAHAAAIVFVAGVVQTLGWSVDLNSSVIVLL